MDKVILDEIQILKLKKFIRGKGVKEADVIHELLDHFACKTEELMSADFTLPFDKAMMAAYFSFGHNGFGIVAQQYEKRIKKMVWREFKKSIPGVLQTNLVIISFIWCCLLTMTTLYFELHPNDSILSESVVHVQFFTMLCFYAIQFKLFVWPNNSLADHACNDRSLLWQKKVMRTPKIDLLFLPFLCANYYFKFDPLFLITVTMFMSFSSLLNGMIRKETMNTLNMRLTNSY